MDREVCSRQDTISHRVRAILIKLSRLQLVIHNEHTLYRLLRLPNRQGLNVCPVEVPSGQIVYELNLLVHALAAKLYGGVWLACHVGIHAP